jgi:hypothetical protein
MSPRFWLFLFLLYIHSEALGFCPFRDAVSKTPTRRRLDETYTPLEGQIPAATDMSDPLVVANENFHSNYDQAKSDVVPQIKMMVEGDYVVLHLRNGSRLVEQVNTKTFHNLKMVSHLPLNAYIILLANTSETIGLETQQLDQLNTFLILLQNITLDQSQFDTAEQLDRQLYIQDATMQFVTSVINSRQCSFDQLADFAWNIAAYATAPNLDDAAEISVNNTHAIVMGWKENLLSEADWEELYTISVAG